MAGFLSRTLTGKTLLRIAVLGAAVLVVFGVLGVCVLYRQIQASELQRLALQAAERARVAEQVLAHVAEMHRTVRDEFVRRWPLSQDAATARRFEELLVRDVAGAWRSRPEIADGHRFPTGEALGYLDEQDFDVVVTDLKMPGMDGQAFYREIVRLRPQLASRVAVMTGDALSGSAREFVRVHGLPLLDKPFQPREVLELVQQVASRSDAT